MAILLDYGAVIRELRAEAKLIEFTIKELEARATGRPMRGRKSMPPEERADVSKRMKAYWAKRRTGKLQLIG